MTKSEILQIAKPILFNTEMVRALLEGRKTATRRVMKPQPLFKTHRKYVFDDDVCPKKWESCDDIITTYQYQPGDYLYVRETWQCLNPYSDKEYVYKASCDEDFAKDIGNWKPSIHMPKEAARIFLRVTDVRVERLQDISEEQAIKEGCYHGALFEGGDTDAIKARGRFITLWDSTIKKQDLDRYGWEANPWVWVIEFEKVNVDAR